MPALLLLLIIVPLVEIFILIEVGKVVGALSTIGLCVLTAVIGGLLLRQQGMETLRRARTNMDRGTVPAVEMFEGMALAVGGVMLLTPGFATDLIGFACLIPFTRRLVVHALMRRVHVQYGPIDGQARRRPPSGQDAIEGEFERRDQDRHS
ncbi:FxsA family protein [Aquisalimonas sp.]|uniref:FxsA family protein n=1 Tax=unclassified Aquisalimonas TaxID=2644645 RepID=UPI0025C73202|nr:FxsA family protein [Aquisalimonas sp.]